MKFKQEILDTLKEFNGFISGLQSKKDKLKKELSRIDGKKNDLLHYIEGVCDGKAHPMRIYKALSDTLRERREIKDEYEIVQSILDHGQFANIGTVNKIIKKVEGIPKHYNNRHYSKDFDELKESKEDNNV